MKQQKIWGKINGEVHQKRHLQTFSNIQPSKIAGEQMELGRYTLQETNEWQ